RGVKGARRSGSEVGGGERGGRWGRRESCGGPGGRASASAASQSRRDWLADASQPVRTADDDQGSERDPEALHGDRYAERSVERGDQPVAEHRFVEAREVVERRVDEILRLEHLPRGLDVERFVRVPDRGVAERDEIHRDCGSQQNPQNSVCSVYSAARLSAVVSGGNGGAP